MNTIEFKINNLHWTINEISEEDMIKKYNQDLNGIFLYGFCDEVHNCIWICSDMNNDNKILTLKHELCHCYLCCYGLRIKKYDEENVCDIVANSNDFVNKILKKYIKEYGYNE